MKLPLDKRLKKRAHVEVALLQDELVDAVYSVENNAVLRGGTAIWRCYGGSRFSEDLDFYASKKIIEIEGELRKRGLEASKFKQTENLLYAKASNGETEVRLEANFASKKRGTVCGYERADGGMMQILSLTPEELLLEKTSAYYGRRLARDLYDAQHLSGLVENEAAVATQMRKFVSSIPKPVDEGNLKAILYAGAIPSFEQLRDALTRRWK